MKRIKKMVAAGLVFALIFAMVPAISLPVRAQATPASVPWDGTVDISWYDPNQYEFFLSTPAEFAGLAALVNGMADPTAPRIIGDTSLLQTTAIPDFMLVGAGGGSVTDTVYRSERTFAYKTIFLTADLNMGAVYSNGEWSGPNWAPIGGRYPMRPEVIHGDAFILDSRFNGMIDGQGHRIYNIFCDRFAMKGFPHSQAIGLIGFMGGTPGGGSGDVVQFENGWQPGVRNLTVGPGLIYGRRMVGGIVGRIGATSNGVIIENAANFADVRNTDARGVGGIVGAGWGDGVIRNAFNAGNISTTFPSPAGGILASNAGMSIYNVYSVGTIESAGNMRGRGIGGHDQGSYNIANAFFLEGSDDDPNSNGWWMGGSRRITVDVQALTAEQMRTPAFVDKLNASGTVFVADTQNINNGFPILWFQAPGGNIGDRDFDVTVEQPAVGGGITADLSGAVSSGRTVTLSAQPDAGWILAHFTLDGRPIPGNFITVSADSVVSAVFVEVRQVEAILPHSPYSHLTFTRTGYRMFGDEAIYVENELINNGDILLEGNILRVFAIPLVGGAPSDVNMEFTGGHVTQVVNAERNPDGSFTVTGAGDVEFTVTRLMARKSWITLADSSWFTGGSEYTLTTAAELAGMARLVNVEGNSLAGVTIKLGNDISLANTDGTGGVRVWEACGRNSSRVFSGTFDGQDHTIYNMTARNSGSYAGLFGYIVDAEIRNVTVRGTVTSESRSAYAAGIVAYAINSIIENTVNRAVINAYGVGAGGIAAFITEGTVVANNVNRAPVTGMTGVGGIVGISDSRHDVISYNHNYGTVRSTGDGSFGTGGIAGQLSGLMTGSGNFADVTGTDRFTGGLAGITVNRLGSRIENSISTGTVFSSSANRFAAVGSAVGHGLFLEVENVFAEGDVSVGATFISPYRSGFIAREGTVIERDTQDETLLPVAGEGTDVWTPGITQQEANNEPEFVRPEFVRGGETITQNGFFYIDPTTSGIITVSDGVTVTLDGSFGASMGLSIAAGAGVKLTLDNVHMTGTQTLLTLTGGTLVMQGENTLINITEARSNTVPTVSVSGSVFIEGTGSLYALAPLGNTSVKLEPSARLELRSGTLSLHKNGLLGIRGGSLYALDGTVVISGGVFNGASNSDNVSVIAAGDLTISGGTVRAQAFMSPVAIDADRISVTGGRLYVFGHTGNSHDHTKAYYGAAAISGLSGIGDASFGTVIPYRDVYVTADYYEAVRFVSESGYMPGVTGELFAPQSGMTQIEFMEVLYRLAGRSLELADGADFISNYDITLEEAAVLITRYLNLSGMDTTPIDGNSGAGASNWARASVAWAVENGLLQEGGNFTEAASRSQLAQAIHALRGL